MTKQSANPRRYSKGDSLDFMQPIFVYFALKIGKNELKSTLARIDYLAEQHPDAVVSFAACNQEENEITLTLSVNMGPARQALRGNGVELSAGYSFLWDVQKVLFYSNPILCAPPNPKEQEAVKGITNLPNLDKKEKVVSQI